MQAMHSSSLDADMRALQLPVRGVLCPAGGVNPSRQASGQRHAGSHQSGGQVARQVGDIAAPGRKPWGSYTTNAQKLLAHGPLTAIEFVEITGWSDKAARRTLQWLHQQEVLTVINEGGKRKYQLA